MKMYNWKTSTGKTLDSFSRLDNEFYENPFDWYQAVLRTDNSQPTIVKYVCDDCGETVVGITFENLINKDISLNDIMLHKYDFYPEDFMLDKKQIDDTDIELFENEYTHAFRDIDCEPFKTYNGIQMFFKNKENIDINTPVRDLT